MSPTMILVLTAAAALVVGAGLGWLLGSRRRSKRDVIVDLENRLEQAIEARADYEAEVTEHFTRTAELLNQLTANYSAVYNHLATGADSLCEGNVAIAGLTVTGGDDRELPANLVELTQPLDYAPRDAAEGEGQLSESFGLEKASFAKEGGNARASV